MNAPGTENKAHRQALAVANQRNSVFDGVSSLTDIVANTNAHAHSMLAPFLDLNTFVALYQTCTQTAHYRRDVGFSRVVTVPAALSTLFSAVRYLKNDRSTFRRPHGIMSPSDWKHTHPHIHPFALVYEKHRKGLIDHELFENAITGNSPLVLRYIYERHSLCLHEPALRRPQMLGPPCVSSAVPCSGCGPGNKSHWQCVLASAQSLEIVEAFLAICKLERARLFAKANPAALPFAPTRLQQLELISEREAADGHCDECEHLPCITTTLRDLKFAVHGSVASLQRFLAIADTRYRHHQAGLHRQSLDSFMPISHLSEDDKQSVTSALFSGAGSSKDTLAKAQLLLKCGLFTVKHLEKMHYSNGAMNNLVMGCSLRPELLAWFRDLARPGPEHRADVASLLQNPQGLFAGVVVYAVNTGGHHFVNCLTELSRCFRPALPGAPLAFSVSASQFAPFLKRLVTVDLPEFKANRGYPWPDDTIAYTREIGTWLRMHKREIADFSQFYAQAVSEAEETKCKREDKEKQEQEAEEKEKKEEKEREEKHQRDAKRLAELEKENEKLRADNKQLHEEKDKQRGTIDLSMDTDSDSEGEDDDHEISIVARSSAPLRARISVGNKRKRKSGSDDDNGDSDEERQISIKKEKQADPDYTPGGKGKRSRRR